MELFVHGVKEERGGQRVTLKPVQVLKKNNNNNKSTEDKQRWTEMKDLSAFPSHFLVPLPPAEGTRF